MLTPLGKILNYISSYLILYPLLMFRVVLASGGTGWTDISSKFVFLIPLAILLVLSIIWVSGLLRWKNNTRINGAATQNNTIEMAVYVATYIVPMIWIEATVNGLLVSIVLYVVVGIVFIRSDKDHLNPTFLLFGYKSYMIGNKTVLAKGSLDALNIAIAEHPNGISARELVKNTYIILPQ